MRTLKFLLEKEFLQIFRNKTILRLVFFMPVFQLLVLPWAATFEQKNILLSIIDNDHSTASRELIQKILSSGYFKLANYSTSYSAALKIVEKNEADLILEIPHHFEDTFIKEKSTDVMLSVNAINGQKAGLGSSYLGQILAAYNLELVNQSQNLGQIFVKPYYIYNTEMNYRNFMVPGILVMLLSIIGGALSSLNIVKEKEAGTIEQINVTPIPKYIFIIGKLIPFWVMGMLILSIGMFIAWLVYGIVPAGHIMIIYIFCFFYLIAFTGFGLMISNFSSTQQQAMFVLFFIIIIFFLLGGLYTPISSMPRWAQIITMFNPVRYFIEVMRLVYMKGSTLADISHQLYIIIIFAVVLNVGAILSYKKTN
ncbi:ABC-2 type transport system permease protein [Apibacter mensalis]|uniref:ABC-2 type transport system permease protein n=1 Tax=Apibacter mensalis TaxID=1586267 RepID=A0A0X8XXG9_9FLAO|nr:ABC transporter permease [Apibacter mensalis]CVK15209.1 ABC-2 type transport system permease protein [Apibacter mensalis]